MTSPAVPTVREASCDHGFILDSAEPNATRAGIHAEALYLCADCASDVAEQVEAAAAKAKADEEAAAKAAKDAEAQSAKDAKAADAQAVKDTKAADAVQDARADASSKPSAK